MHSNTSLPDTAKQLAGDAEEPCAQAISADRRNIYRVGPDGGTAWNVHLRRGPQCFRKRFADSKHGGEEGALAAARAWRDELERLHPLMTKQEVIARKTPPASGRRGIYRVLIRQRRKDGSFIANYVWDAGSPSWNGVARHRRFSVAKYGEEEAFRLAVAAREAFEAEAEEAGRQPFHGNQSSPKQVSLRNIHRADTRKNTERAWTVIVKRASLAAPLNKRFADKTYGSKAASLAAAICWRDEMERLHPRLDRKARLSRLSKASTSGVKGVYQQHTPRLLADGSTRVSTFWTAKTPSGIVPEVTRSFSIEKYGEREAFRMAVEARHAFEKKLLEQSTHE
jgi:hypothetical protein